MNHTVQTVLSVIGIWFVVSVPLSVLLGKFIEGARELSEGCDPNRYRRLPSEPENHPVA